MFSTRTLRVRRRPLDRAVLAVVAAAGVSSAMTLGAPDVAEACMSVGYAAPPVTVAPAPGSRAYIRFDSYATFGGSAGQYCACALRAFPGLFSTVNAVKILGVGGFSFLSSPTTSTSAGSVLGSSAFGFLANITESIPVGEPAQVEFDVSLEAGQTVQDLADGLSAADSVVVTDEGTASGSLANSHLSVRPAGEIVISQGVGDPHLRTFEGSFIDFYAIGELDAVTTSGPAPFTVQIRTARYSKSTSIISAVAMNVDGDRVGFYVSPTRRILVNGQPAEFTCDGASQQVICRRTAALPGGGLVRERPPQTPGEQAFDVLWPGGEVVVVHLRNGYVDIQVFPPGDERGQVAGLFGSPDGDPFNDVATRSGEVLPLPLSFDDLYHRFGDSWRITNETSLFDYGPGEDTSTYTDMSAPEELLTLDDMDPAIAAAARAVCEEAGVKTPILLEACTTDVAQSGDASFVDSYVGEREPVRRVRVEPNLLDGEHRASERGCAIGSWQSGWAGPGIAAALALGLVGLRRREGNKRRQK